MVDLYKADQSVRNNNRPKPAVIDTINNKADTADHIDHPNFSYIFQNETQYDKN